MFNKQFLLGVACCTVASAPVFPAESTAATAALPSVTAPADYRSDAPNIVIVLLDDVGFGASATFGGAVATPTLDELAAHGLRYNNLFTTAICSPTRAALLTGRNPHAVGVGTVVNVSDSRPGYSGVLSANAATIAEVLRQAGYSTAAFGKWHLTPDRETSQVGPFDRWPTQRGFERFYGFLGGETDQFHPTLIDGMSPVLPSAKPDYYLTTDLADHAIDWLRTQHSLAPDRPFLLYFAPGATHAPLQVPKPWIDRYRGNFSQGWDKMREEIFARQKKLGVIPKDTILTPRMEGLPAWDKLAPGEKRAASRMMEVYAGFLSSADHEVGRIVRSLKDSGQFDNTLFVFIAGDNGGSMEGGTKGSINYWGDYQGLGNPGALQEQIESLGGPDGFGHYPAGWAWAMNTPFRWAKTIGSHLGGIRNPMVISWPKGINEGGSLRSQFVHVNDVMPTVLEVTGVAMPSTINGNVQMPLNGVSFAYSFTDPAAPAQHRTQYFETLGSRAIYSDGWLASAFHRARMPWDTSFSRKEIPMKSDVWELYDLSSDFSQANDLASKQPKRLKQMQQLFMAEATANQVLPLEMPATPLPVSASAGKTMRFYPGTISVPEALFPRFLARSWRVQAQLALAEERPAGVVASMGSRAVGWTLYVDEKGLPTFVFRAFDAQTIELKGEAPLPPGRNEIEVRSAYDGGPPGAGAQLTLIVNGRDVARDRLNKSPLLISIGGIDAFDVGIDTGSPVAYYPADDGYPFVGGEIDHVDFTVE